MSVEGWFTSEDLILEPGTRVTVPLTVHNLGRTTDSYTIVPAGLNAAWTSVGAANLTLFAGSRETVPVTIAPPALPSTSAGPTVIGVRITSDSDPDVAVQSEVTVGVAAFDDRRVVPLNPVVRARRRATFELMVENHGNALASCRMRLVDPSGRIDGDFDPPAVGVSPGDSTLVRLKSKVVGSRFRRSTRTLDFEVEAEQPGRAPAATSFAFVQSPTIAGSVVGKAAWALLAAGVLAGGWFGLIKPAIDDAVEQKVSEQIAELAPQAPVQTTPPDDDTDQSDATVVIGEPETTPLFERLTVNARIGSTDDATFTVPAPDVFDLTDVRLENPFRDDGVATLLINAEPLFVWSLADVRASQFEPRLTPIRLQPGDNITFSVRCDAPADGASCDDTAVLLGGTTQPSSDD